MPSADEEAQLLARARAGDVEAFAELVRRHEQRVRAILFRLLDDPRDVDEATQDAFVQVWRSLASFRGDAAVFTWLYRIAVNEAYARLRRRRLPLVELEEAERRPDETALGQPEATAERAELRDVLVQAIRRLPMEYRAPLVLRDVVGLRNDEVAEILELSLAAAKSRIHRARMQVRAEVEAWEAGRETH
jgi:RNA polymerase sigma-70 factor (ECF subfamily)